MIIVEKNPTNFKGSPGENQGKLCSYLLLLVFTLLSLLRGIYEQNRAGFSKVSVLITDPVGCMHDVKVKRCTALIIFSQNMRRNMRPKLRECKVTVSDRRTFAKHTVWILLL